MPSISMSRAVAIFTVLAALTFTASASADTPFSVRYSANDTGDIVGVANTLMTCPSGASGCSSAQNAGADTSATANDENNAFTMGYVDTDSDPSTFDSSSANLSMPAGSTVLFAGLYWGGDYTQGTAAKVGDKTVAGNKALRGQVDFKVPGASSYTTETANAGDVYDSTTRTGSYQGFKDVTAAVAAAGNGTYWVGNVQAGTGEDRYAGWTLIVVYHNPSSPPRNLTVFDGLTTIAQSAGPTNITVSGFTTPPTGPVNTEVGFVTYEGDDGIVGDSAAVDGHTLSDAAHPATNFFDSKISRDGSLATGGNPSYADQLGYDSAFTSANGDVPNGATSATITLKTSGDQYLPGVITFATDLYTPNIVQTKTVTDTNGNSPPQEGDVLTYTITGTDQGGDAAKNFVLRDPIPPNTTYVPGSLNVVAGAGAPNGSRTDGSGDDGAEFDSSGNQVVFRLGSGANATTGGVVATGATYTVTFKVKVNGPTPNPVPPGTDVPNTATASFLGQTTGIPLTATASADTHIAAPDLTITKTRTGPPIVAGSTSEYTLATNNHGTAPTQGTVTVHDTVPTGMTATSITAPGWNCTATPTTDITCTRSDALAAGSSYPPIVIEVSIGAGVAGNVSNTATVSGGGDADLTDNSSTDTEPSSQSADVSLKKTVSDQNVAVGDTFTYTLTATNNGPSTATSVAITDPIPAGLQYVSSTPTCAIDPPTGTLGCAVGTLTNGQSASVTVTVKALPSAAEQTVTNTATVGAQQNDPDPTNNHDSASTHVGGADLATTKTYDGPANPHVGDTVSYTLKVTNNGPSTATGATVVDTLPAGLTGASADDPNCTVSGGSITCPAGDLANGDSYTVHVTGTIAAGTNELDNVATGTSDLPDPDPTNDTAKTTTVVPPSADLSVTKTASPGSLTPGSTEHYTIAVHNAGPDSAQNAVVTDTLPASLTFVSAPAGCTFDSGTSTITCTIATIAAGDTVNEDIVTTVANTATGNVTNSASVTSDTFDPDPSNNTGTTTNPVPDNADLQITKTASPQNPAPGDTVTYTLHVTNNGPGTAANATVTDPLPAGVTFASADSGCTNDSGTVNCALGDLAPGDSRTITITATVDPVSTPSPDPQSSDLIQDQKVEQQIDMDPQSTVTASVSCPAGYIVTDGSQRVDEVDQGTGTLASVHVLESEATGPSTWQVTLRNDATGRAQAKIFAMCIAQTFPDDTGGTSSIQTSAPVTTTVSMVAGTHTVSLPCGPDQTAISPGYSFAGGDATVLSSEPNGSGWTWTVNVPEGTQATFSITCMNRQTTDSQGHTHELLLSELQQTVTVPPGQVTTAQVICPDLAEGITADWTLDPGLDLLGNDPQPKTRVFTLFNPTNAPLNATVSLLCLGNRTGPEEAVASAVNTANVSSSTPDLDPSNNADSATVNVNGQTSTTPPVGPPNGTQAGAGNPPPGTTTTDGGGGGNSSSAPPPGGATNAVLHSAVLRLSTGGTPNVTLSCPAGSGTCAGSAGLFSKNVVRLGGHRIAAGTKLASARYRIVGGKIKRISLKLTKVGARLLREHRIHLAVLELIGPDHRIHRHRVKLGA